MQDALVGFTVDIRHLDGRMVTVQRDKITKHGTRIRKKNEGMPNYDNNNVYGSLYITFDVAFPDNEFTEEQKEGESICAILVHLKILFCYINYNRILCFRHKKVAATKFREPNIQWYTWQLNI